MHSLADWSGKRVLVTGATGFIGRHLVKRLTETEAQVYAGTSPAGQSDRPPQSSPLAPRPLAFDVRDTEAVKSAVREAVPDVVFHLASAGVTNPALCPPGALMVNVGGAVNLLEALRGSRVQRVVLVGTSYEYGARQAAEGLDPMNAYAASKVAAWAFGRMYWRAFELPTVTVRPFQVYGPGQPKQTLVPAAMSAALSGRDFPITPGEQQRDFIYVEDVAEGMIAAAEAPDVEGESLDLGTGIGNAIRRVVERIWRLAGGVGKVEFGALPYRSGDAIHLIADADRTAQLTGWRAATPLAEGLRATLQSQRLET